MVLFFYITKFSLKLIEQLMIAVGKTKISHPGLIGVPLEILLKDLKNRGYEFEEYLKPLAGL